MKQLHGIVAAMVTPYDAHDHIDLAALDRLTDFLVAAGIHCLYPLGTTGEMHLLSVEERKRVAEAVIARNAGRATVYIHVAAMTLADSMTLARHAHAAGADGIAVVTPSYFGVTDREMEEWFVAIAGSVPADYPVYLYNIPQLAVNDLTPAVIERVVARCPNVVGIKYSGMDFIRISDYLKIRGGNFSVVIGGDRLAIAGAAMGCDGVVSGTCCAVPELYVRLWNAIQKGEAAEAARLQRAQQEYSALVKHGGSMPLIKQALMLRGVFQDVFTRPPLLPPSPQEAADFTRAFNTWRLTSSPASPGCCSS